MKKFLLAASAAAAAMAAVPAQSAVYLNSFGSSGWGPGANQFQLDGSFGPTATLYKGPLSLTMDAGDLIFEYVGAESSFANKFNFTPLALVSGSASKLETDEYINLFATPEFIGRGTFAAGSLAGLLSFDTPFNYGSTYALGDTEVGIVVDSSYVLGTALTSFYIVLDDNGAGPDDNHDDMVIKVTAVPEPTTWALMIAGIAAVGVSMRRRSQGVRVAFS